MLNSITVFLDGKVFVISTARQEMGCGFSKPAHNRSTAEVGAEKYGTPDLASPTAHPSTSTPTPTIDDDVASIGRPTTPEGRVAEEPSAMLLRIRMAYAEFMAQISDRQHTAEEESAQQLEVGSLSGTPRKDTPRRVVLAMANTGQLLPSVHESATAASSLKSPPPSPPHRGGTQIPASSDHNAGSVVTQSSNSSLLHHELSVMSKKLDVIKMWIDATLPHQPQASGKYLEMEVAVQPVAARADTARDVLTEDVNETMSSSFPPEIAVETLPDLASTAMEDSDALAHSLGEPSLVALFARKIRSHKGCPAAGAGTPPGASCHNHLNARNLFRHINLMMVKSQQPPQLGTVADAAILLMAAGCHKSPLASPRSGLGIKNG